MKLKGIEFGKVLGASGTQGFFGEGYWFHRYLKPFGLNFDGMTFVAKTTTLNRRGGNMPLLGNFTPQELLPKCIHVNPWQGIALNSVGLSGPGTRALLVVNRWQMRQNPFFISFMSVAATAKERIEELTAFVGILKSYLRRFRAPVGLQINYSCPTAGIHIDDLFQEASEGLSVASRLGIPLMPKFSVVMPPKVAREIANHQACDGICISNTIPYGQMADRIDWQKFFGTQSPLEQYGGGGLSGKLLLPLLLEWLDEARRIGLEKPINAGGGILCLKDAKKVMKMADSIFLGSIAFLRPWRVARIIRAING